MSAPRFNLAPSAACDWHRCSVRGRPHGKRVLCPFHVLLAVLFKPYYDAPRVAE